MNKYRYIIIPNNYLNHSIISLSISINIFAITLLGTSFIQKNDNQTRLL